MSDELRRRFRDKIQGRPAPGRRLAAVSPEGAGGAPFDGTFRILDLEHGPFPAAASLNQSFGPGLSRIRLTIDVGEEIFDRAAGLGAPERASLLSLCPRLALHDCGNRDTIHAWLSEGPFPAGADRLTIAHLIEHLAIDLIAPAMPGRRGRGAACAYRDRPDRFDIFLECGEPLLGRAAAVLASAALRDLCLGRDRLALHIRCRDLLHFLRAMNRPQAAPEAVARALRWSPGEADEAFEALTRLGYLDPIQASFTFSSPTGTLFRRATPPRTRTDS